MDIEDIDIAPAPVPVRVVPITTRKTSEPLEVEGRFAASRAVLIKSPTSGVVEELTVSLGDRVEAGQLLCTVGASAAKQRALATESTIAMLESQIAEREDALEQAKARPDNPQRIKSQEAKLRASQHKLAQEKIQRERHALVAKLVEVRARFEGFVAAVNAANGGSVMHGHALIEIVEADPVVFVVDVPTWVRSRCHKGTEVEVVSRSDESPRRGVIARWAPTASDGVRRLLVDVDNADGRIAAGERGAVFLPVGEREAFFAPRHALLHKDKKIQLQLVEHNRVLVRNVRVFGGGEREVEVAGQLDDGHLVVLHSDRPLSESTAVVIRGDH